MDKRNAKEQHLVKILSVQKILDKSYFYQKLEMEVNTPYSKVSNKRTVHSDLRG